VLLGDKAEFLSMRITTYRKDLLKKANDKRKAGLVISASSLDGKVFAKTSPSGTLTIIYQKEDLENV